MKYLLKLCAVPLVTAGALRYILNVFPLTYINDDTYIGILICALLAWVAITIAGIIAICVIEPVGRP